MIYLLLVIFSINIMICCAISYVDHCNGIDITIRDLFYILVFSLIPFSGIFLALYALNIGYDRPVIKGRRNK